MNPDDALICRIRTADVDMTAPLVRMWEDKLRYTSQGYAGIPERIIVRPLKDGKTLRIGWTASDVPGGGRCMLSLFDPWLETERTVSNS